MASKPKDDEQLVKVISQIKNQVKDAINHSESVREAVQQQATDLQRQVDEFRNRTNEVIDNNVRMLQSLDEQLVQCSKLLDHSLVSDTEKDATTDTEICTSPGGSSETDSDESHDHSKPFSSNSRSNDNVNISESMNGDNSPGREDLQLTSDSSDFEKSGLQVNKTLYQPSRQKKHYLTWNRLTLAQKTHEDDDGKLVTSNIGQVKVIDGYGEENEQFKYPYLLVNGPNSELIVSDRDSHQLIVFDDNLQFLYAFGGRGKELENGIFYNPTGLAVDNIGNFLYVADQGNRIQRFKMEKDSSCTFVSRFGAKGTGKGQFNCPCGLLYTRSEQLFVCDFRNHRIQVFDKEGKFLHAFGRHGSKPREFNEPHSIAINNDQDKVFITDHNNNRIQIFSPHGKFLTIINNGPSLNHRLQYPRGIFYTPDGHLLVSCTYTHCILELKEDGGNVSTTEEIIQPGGVVLRCNSDIVVTSNVNQVLVVIDGCKTDN